MKKMEYIAMTDDKCKIVWAVATGGSWDYIKQFNVKRINTEHRLDYTQGLQLNKNFADTKLRIEERRENKMAA